MKILLTILAEGVSSPEEISEIIDNVKKIDDFGGNISIKYSEKSKIDGDMVAKYRDVEEKNFISIKTI